jgi:hypothetical protein
VTSRTRVAALAVAATLSLAFPRRACAQSVADILSFLVTNQSVQTGDFERDRSAAAATSETISRALLANLATLPVATSSGAFAYRLNEELGTVERSTESFGPFFVERSLTAGRHQLSFGLTVQHLHFTSLDGRNLGDGSLITTANQFVDEQTPFDVDRLTLNIDASIATLYGNMGLTDRMEIGFAAPMVRLTLDGSRVNTYRGRTFMQARAAATAVGLADLVVRTKYTLYKEQDAGVAAAVDVRLPTGRSEDLLGTGSTSMKLSGIGSLERRRLSTHVNGGFSIGGLARELSYGGAVALAVTPRVTVSGEMLGRWLSGVGRVLPVLAPNPGIAGVETIRLLPDASGLNMIRVTPGVKWNVTRTWVLNTSVSIPLTEAGLTSTVIPLIGLDYAFGR